VQCIGKLTVLNKQDEERQAMEQALRLRTKDAFLEYHAGVSFEQTGDADKAKARLQRALSNNPHFHAILRAY
jgi:Flp pilus assembly protein TadD